MDKVTIANWMLNKLVAEGCVYQDDVVDYLVRAKEESFLTENSDGNQVLSNQVLDEFKKLTSKNVVWVRSGFYWRHRVPEDEPGRNAHG